MVITKLFFTAFFIVLREFLYKTLIHLIIGPLIQEISVVYFQAQALKIPLPVKHNALISGCLQCKIEVSGIADILIGINAVIRPPVP